MRLSELIHMPVFDADGKRIGWVSDVRAEQMVAGEDTSYVVIGLLTTPHKFVGQLGFDDHHDEGPWLIRKLLSTINRRARYATWDHVASVDDAVRLNVFYADLVEIPSLPSIERN